MRAYTGCIHYIIRTNIKHQTAYFTTGRMYLFHSGTDVRALFYCHRNNNVLTFASYLMTRITVSRRSLFITVRFVGEVSAKQTSEIILHDAYTHYTILLILIFDTCAFQNYSTEYRQVWLLYNDYSSVFRYLYSISRYVWSAVAVPSPAWTCRYFRIY